MTSVASVKNCAPHISLCPIVEVFAAELNLEAKQFVIEEISSSLSHMTVGGVDKLIHIFTVLIRQNILTVSGDQNFLL